MEYLTIIRDEVEVNIPRKLPITRIILILFISLCVICTKRRLVAIL